MRHLAETQTHVERPRERHTDPRLAGALQHLGRHRPVSDRGRGIEIERAKSTDMRNLCFLVVLGLAFVPQPQRTARHTVVGIEGREFVVNGAPTYAGRSYDGMSVQGLLFNSRMVQGIFDDRNPETRGRWNYPDGPVGSRSEHPRVHRGDARSGRPRGCWLSPSTCRAAARRVTADRSRG